MASMITERGTPFSLATASITSNSSLLISTAPWKAAGRLGIGSGFLVRPGLAAPGARRLGCGRQAQRHQVGDQARLLDVVVRQRQLDAVLRRQHDAVALDPDDPALDAAPAVHRQAQLHLGLLAGEA